MKRILYAGKLSWGKGPHLLVKALPYIGIPFRLTLCGRGAQEAMLRGLVENSGFAHCVTFAGQVSHDELQTRMGEADVVVVPSIWQEPFGRVALEALLAGTPVVCSDRGGLPEIVQDGVTGYVVHILTTYTEPTPELRAQHEEHDARAFAAAILKIIGPKVIVIREEA